MKKKQTSVFRIKDDGTVHRNFESRYITGLDVFVSTTSRPARYYGFKFVDNKWIKFVEPIYKYYFKVCVYGIQKLLTDIKKKI